jgi:hypothetical protein
MKASINKKGGRGAKKARDGKSGRNGGAHK